MLPLRIETLLGRDFGLFAAASSPLDKLERCAHFTDAQVQKGQVAIQRPRGSSMIVQATVSLSPMSPAHLLRLLPLLLDLSL